MGLKEKLQTQGSILSINDGNDPSINPLVDPETSKNFSLHYTSNIDAPGPGDGSPGYSVTGGESEEVNSFYQTYEDGSYKPLPPPTKLDLNELTPVAPNYQNNYTPTPGQRYSDLYNSF